VQHTISLRVNGGPLRSFDVHIADRDVILVGEPTFVLTGGAMDARMPIPVGVEQRPDGPLRVNIDEGKGVRRGIYDFVVTYDVDLLKQNGVTRDGSMLVVSWVGARWDDGIDSVRTTFVVPTTATSPRAVDEVRLDGPNDEVVMAPLGGVLTTLTQYPEVDELEQVRPHVASGEVVTWKVKVDPAVFGEVQDPRLKAPPPPEAVLIAPERRAAFLAVGGMIAVLYSLLLTLKHRQVVRSSRVRGVHPRPLIPVGIAVRMAFSGPLLAASVGAQVFLEHPFPGAVGVFGVILLSAYRVPEKRVSPRGPGRWLPLSDRDAFEKKEDWPWGWLDAGSPLGKAVFAIVSVLYAVGVWLVSRHATYFAYVAALDFVVIVVLFGTGRRTELPADLVHSAAPLLARVAKELRKSKKLVAARVRGLGRIPKGTEQPDELRLGVWPKGAIQGFRGIEIGLGWAHAIGQPVALPQVLLRVLEGSPCHEAVNQRLRKARWIRGRETHERVMVLNPAVPTLDMTVKLAESISQIVSASTPSPGAQAVSKPTAASRAYVRLCTTGLQ